MNDPDTTDPLRGEAQAQDEATLMPWIWGGFGMLVIAAFVTWTILAGGHRVREPAGVAPQVKPASQHY